MPSECVKSIGSEIPGFLKRSAARGILLLPLLVISTLISYSQSYYYEIEQIPLENELYGISGTSILQDRDGFIWFTSQNALIRYDGIEYVQYHMQPSNLDGKTLSAEKINSMLQDEDGFIWIGGTNLVRFDPRTGDFKEFRDTFEDPDYSWAFIDCMVDDKEGNLWIGNAFRLVKFNKKSGTYNRFPLHQIDHIDHMMIDRRGYLWMIYGDNELGRYDVERDQLEAIPNAPCTLKTLFEDRNGRFWICTYCGIYLFDPAEKSFTPYFFEPDDPNRLHNQMVRAILEDRSSNLWIRTFDGVYMYDETLQLKYHWKHAIEYKNSALHYSITNALYEDIQGNIWFFTENEICRIIRKYRNFRVYDPLPEEQSYVDQIFEDCDMNIWFRLNYSLCKLNRDTLQHERYLFHAEDSMLMDNIAHNEYALCLDNSQNFWIAELFEGLYKLTSGEDQIMQAVPVYEIPDSLHYQKYITFPFVDSRDRIWFIMNRSEIYFFDQDKHKIFRLHDNPESKTRLPGSVQVLCEYDSTTLLAGGWSGLYKIVLPLTETGEGTVMPADIAEIRMQGDARSINLVSIIIVSKVKFPGTIWANSERGIVKVSEEEIKGNQEAVYTGKYFTTRDGLVSNTAESMLEDMQGNIWIGSRNGLSKLDPLSENITIYNTRNGLPSNRILGSMKGKMGELFFGTDNGLFSIIPDSFRYNMFIPPIVLTEFRINNRELVPGEKSLLNRLITYTGSLELSYKQNNISFAFASLNYTESGRNEYKYQLEGLNEDWIYAGHKNRAEFTNLRPGEYVFRVLGSNNEGVWNEDGAQLIIRIKPPPWRTWWAFFIYASLLLLLIRGYRSYLLTRAKFRTALEIERIEKEKVLEIDHMRSRFFANITHEFRSPLALLITPLEDSFKNKAAIGTKMQRIMLNNARRLQRLINQLLDISKLESGKMELQLVKASLSDFVRAIASSFSSLAESRSIQFSIQIEKENEDSCFDSEKMEIIITNLLSNAFKFCEDGGRVVLSLRYGPGLNNEKPGSAQLTVADTGKGMEKEQLDKIFDRFYQVSDSDTREVEGSGIGLALTKELVELLHGSIEVESAPGKGTVFRLYVPVLEECFSEQEISGMSQKDGPGSDLLKAEDIRSEYDDSQSGRSGQPAVNSKEVILVVEDNPDLRFYICGRFKPRYRVLEAENGKNGLDKAIEHIPDLVITDLMMPVMGGMEMCRKLKEHPVTNHIPVIILTAKADKDSQLEGLETAADDYISKPFDSDLLLARTGNLIEQRKALRKHFEQELILSDNSKPSSSPQFRMLREIIQVIDEHLDDPTFDLSTMTKQLNMSRSGIYRKVFAITGFKPHELLRAVRMKRAAAMLRKGEMNVTQVMYQVGMRNPSHFARSFRKFYGMNPGKYRIGNI